MTALQFTISIQLLLIYSDQTSHAYVQYMSVYTHITTETANTQTEVCICIRMYGQMHSEAGDMNGSV